MSAHERYLRPGTLQLGALPPLSLYVHLPWCLKKCPYCDFNSHEWRDGGVPPEARYLDALRADLEASLPLIWGRPRVSRLARWVLRAQDERAEHPQSYCRCVAHRGPSQGDVDGTQTL